MDSSDPSDGLLPPALLDDVKALAATQHRTVADLLCEAVERYMWERRPPMEPDRKRTPQEAAARMLARRPFHQLPEDMTIRDLITYGRA